MRPHPPSLASCTMMASCAATFGCQRGPSIPVRQENQAVATKKAAKIRAPGVCIGKGQPLRILGQIRMGGALCQSQCGNSGQRGSKSFRQRSEGNLLLLAPLLLFVTTVLLYSQCCFHRGSHGTWQTSVYLLPFPPRFRWYCLYFWCNRDCYKLRNSSRRCSSCYYQLHHGHPGYCYHC